MDNELTNAQWDVSAQKFNATWSDFAESFSELVEPLNDMITAFVNAAKALFEFLAAVIREWVEKYPWMELSQVAKMVYAKNKRREMYYRRYARHGHGMRK